MKKLFALSTIVVLVLFLVGACTVTISTGAYVSGTITFVGKYASGASVTVQQGSSAYGASVNLSGPGAGTQSGTYSIPNVPYGTYTVYVTFYSTESTYVTASFLINGIGPSPFVPGGIVPNWTETIVAVPVHSDTTVDTYLN